MRRFPLGFAAVSSLVALGCSSAPAPTEQVQSRSDEIIGGSPDTTNHAVVAVLGSQSACTATIIAVVGNSGYALTAAHCVDDPPEWVVQGNDYYSQSSIGYQVVEYDAHNGYNGQVYDFAMVRFIGASAQTPVIPAMTPAEDNLQVGSQVEFVGYGITPQDNSVRHHVNGVIDLDVSALLLEYSQDNGGPCSGDSGGPSLSLVGGQKRVSGVTSYGDQDCAQYGASGRVSAIYDSFITPFIAGGAGEQTCDECFGSSTSGNGACTSDVNACFDDNQCASLADCLYNCSTDACYEQCAQDFSAGIPLYNAIFDCACNACATECASECGGSSSSSSSSGSGSSGPSTTSASSTTGSGTTESTSAGVGGAGAGATGPGTGVGGAVGEDEDDDEPRSRDAGSEGGCSASPGTMSDAGAGALVAVLGLAALSSRRRRRAPVTR